MGYQYVTIDDGKYNMTFDGIWHEYALTRDDDGTPVDATYRYHGDAWVEGSYVGIARGDAVLAYRIGAQTASNVEYVAGRRAARAQTRRRQPTGAHATSSYLAGWRAEWAERANRTEGSGSR